MLLDFHLIALLMFHAWNIVTFHFFSLDEITLSLLLLIKPGESHSSHILLCLFGIGGLFTKKKLCQAYY